MTWRGGSSVARMTTLHWADSGVGEGVVGWRGSARPLSTKVLSVPMELRVNTQMPLGTLLASKRSTATPDCCELR